ncbi:MAG: type II toxin-antitoxin system prevent-host-death family antitoxin [Pseudoxanthomonas suwonensis]|nr:type II toxin-antitoxin system prevent-host-death family antitoxin [Pseudoxanthomonas suwonensis]
MEKKIRDASGRYVVTVNVHEAKTHLSRLLEQVHAGQEIILSKAGKPYARMVPLQAEAPKRQPGRLAGLSLDEAFHAPLPDDEFAGWDAPA